jgi:hypothetical protein
VVHPGNEKSYRGKWFVFALFFGFIAFGFLCGYGTYFAAKFSTPTLKQRSEESIQRIKAEQNAKNP